MKQALLLAAGLGTRLKPLTNTTPKALVRVGGFALLEHNIRRLQTAGFDRIVVNIHHFGEQIIDFLDAHSNFGIDIRISDEREQLLDTGGALKKALPLFDNDSPVLIHNVDIFSDIDLNSLFSSAVDKRSAVLAISRRTSASGRYLLFDEQLRLAGWTNVATGEVRSPYPDALERATLKAPFAGIHVVHPDLFPLLSEWPDRFSIIDFYLRTCRQACIYGYLSNFNLLDVGKLDSLLEAERFLQEHDAYSTTRTSDI
ncbi:MAG: nucleotidyltransferase family protein [Bacteroidaceae bacterium]|nr:nucleotidyltransferase family protein [Bacteroidaceae bacterium]